jgi:hypothetical protein
MSHRYDALATRGAPSDTVGGPRVTAGWFVGLDGPACDMGFWPWLPAAKASATTRHPID